MEEEGLAHETIPSPTHFRYTLAIYNVNPLFCMCYRAPSIDPITACVCPWVVVSAVGMYDVELNVPPQI